MRRLLLVLLLVGATAACAAGSDPAAPVAPAPTAADPLAAPAVTLQGEPVVIREVARGEDLALWFWTPW